MKTQNLRLLEWLKKKTITSLTAVTELGIISLPRRISDLEEMGHMINRSTWVEVDNRFGQKVRVKKYSYLGPIKIYPK